MLNAKATAAPWGFFRHDGSFEIRSSEGHSIAFFYFTPDAGPTTTGGKRHLSKTDAEEVALAMLRLPEVMGWKG